MAKKDFTENPAFKFLSESETEPEQISTEQNAQATSSTTTPKKKKELDQSRLDEIRALIPEDFSIEDLKAIIPTGFKIIEEKEKKTKREAFYVTPALHKRIKAAADRAEISLSEFFTRAVIEKLERENDE